MDVFYALIQNSALEGMPRWYQVTSLFVLAIILTLITFSFYLLMTDGFYRNIQFGY